ncbi:efflux transporter outer membrane subunit [Telluria mixta]|uniref:Efflux transporter outer membrane subunit n=1 Tax=Telluria mixta TaxID=34071 RepID=A0ABT2C0W2_9BURK|nr:efflux transporter outer membrane subunit [Telluria mixta]MCS0630496.1 efflux transporter outer membrane subunit [Telluria mixta]WEM94200.1 efflux transporter outer membrane subunit [Telluria mixta]
MNKSIVTLAIAAMVSGCSLAPVLPPTAPPVAREWPNDGADKTLRPSIEARAASDIAWREFIASEPLRQVVQLALDHNRDLRVSILNIEKARARYGVVDAGRLPHLDAGVGQIAQRVPARQSDTGAGHVARQYSGGVSIPAFELDVFGRVRNMSEAALQQYLGTEEARRAHQISLVAEVVDAWLTLAAERERLQLAMETLGNQQATFELARRRFEAGATSGLDMVEARTSVDAARHDAAACRTRVAAGENALTLLVGTPVPAGLLPHEPLQAVSRLADLPTGVPSDVLRRRPDVAAAERALRAANADIGVARAAFFPSMSLTAFAGGASPGLSGLFKAGSGAWTFAPQLNLPIFTGGANQANLDIAGANRDIALAQYDKALQSAFREVADALAERGTLDERLAAQASLVDAAEKSYRIHDARYRKGVESYLNTLVSQRELYNARQNLIGIRLASASNRIALYKVLGGGWQ